jgi:hypothetical protein
MVKQVTTDALLAQEDGSIIEVYAERSKPSLGSLGKRPRIHRLLLQVAGVLIGLLLFVVLLFVALSVMVHHQKPTYEGNPGNKDVSFTAEYQIKLVNVRAWQDREERISDWMSFMQDHSRFLNVSATTQSTLVRYQYFLDLSGWRHCRSNHEIRVREFERIETGEAGITVDLKESTSTAAKSLLLPFWPAPELKASQKCEEDIHECESKFSRETRISLARNERQLVTCSDMRGLFPWLMSPSKIREQNELSVLRIQHWWVREYSGMLNDTTKFKVSFTLRYLNDQAAHDESLAPTSGEWSIRIYSIDSGLSAQWDDEVRNDTKECWQQLIRRFGNGDCH